MKKELLNTILKDKWFHTRTMLLFVLLIVTVPSFAEEVETPSRLQISTPIQMENSEYSTNLSEEETKAWNSRREERRKARAHLISELKNAPPQDKVNMRQKISEKKGEKPSKHEMSHSPKVKSHRHNNYREERYHSSSPFHERGGGDERNFQHR